MQDREKPLLQGSPEPAREVESKEADHADLGDVEFKFDEKLSSDEQVEQFNIALGKAGDIFDEQFEAVFRELKLPEASQHRAVFKRILDQFVDKSVVEDELQAYSAGVSDLIDSMLVPEASLGLVKQCESLVDDLYFNGILSGNISENKSELVQLLDGFDKWIDLEEQAADKADPTLVSKISTIRLQAQLIKLDIANFAKMKTDQDDPEARLYEKINALKAQAKMLVTKSANKQLLQLKQIMKFAISLKAIELPTLADTLHSDLKKLGLLLFLALLYLPITPVSIAQWKGKAEASIAEEKIAEVIFRITNVVSPVVSQSGRLFHPVKLQAKEDKGSAAEKVSLSVLGWLKKTGKAIVNGIVNGVVNGVKSVFNTIKSGIASFNAYRKEHPKKAALFVVLGIAAIATPFVLWGALVGGLFVVSVGSLGWIAKDVIGVGTAAKQMQKQVESRLDRFDRLLTPEIERNERINAYRENVGVSVSSKMAAELNAVHEHSEVDDSLEMKNAGADQVHAGLRDYRKFMAATSDDMPTLREPLMGGSDGRQEPALVIGENKREQKDVEPAVRTESTDQQLGSHSHDEKEEDVGADVGKTDWTVYEDYVAKSMIKEKRIPLARQTHTPDDEVVDDDQEQDNQNEYKPPTLPGPKAG